MAGGSKFMNAIRVLFGTKTTKKPSPAVRDPCAIQHVPQGDHPTETRFEFHPPKIVPILPSRWQWHKTKDLFHFYFMIGFISVGGILFCSNVFIGQAQLAEIPEDYIPKHWEYHRHPVSRFLARHVFPDPQQEYEKLMHKIYEEDEKAKIRLLERKIREKMAERKDYQAWYYRPAMAKYVRISKEAADYLGTLGGD